MKKIYFLLLFVFVSVSTTFGQVVISQVYGGGGNSGALYTNDFIELFNRGNSAVNLNGWSVQYASATGTSWQVTNLPNFDLQPGQYFLVQQAAGAGGTQALPTPDVIGIINMGGTAFKVLLSNSTTAQSGACPSNAEIVDFVGVGPTASCSETAAAPILSNTTSGIRLNNGCTDSNDNSADFITINPPTPRNSASGTATCSGDPSLLISSPTEGQILPAGVNTIVTFIASNFDIATPGNGDGHLHYTVNGGSVTMVYTNDPIDLGILTPGADYTVAMELVDDSHNALVPPVTASVNFSIAACGLSLTTTTAVCDAFTAGTDTYTATVNFTGGGTDTYVITSDSGTISGDDPSVVASGTITITGIAEGTNVNINVSNGALCDLDILINSPACEAAIGLPAYEGFNYTVGASLNDQANWELFNTGDDITIGGPGGLTYPGLAGSAGTGNHIAFDGAGRESIYDFSPATTGTVYASFIFTVTDQSNVTNADGSYFASISSTNTNYDARLWVKPSTIPASTTYEIGVGNNATSPTGGSNSGPYNVGDVVFVVMSYDMATGTINGWVNPSDATFGLGSAPTATITAVDPTPATSIEKFILRQDTAVRTPFILLDELRIGNTWADVTPTTLSNDDFNVANFSIYPNPTSTGYVNITSTNADAMSVAVFDVLGKQVINETISNNRLDVSSLNTGVYIVKISQNNATVTKKLVIK